MDSGEWHEMMADLLQGIRLCLPDMGTEISAMKVDELEIELSAFVSCLKTFESKVESIISSDPVLEHAAEKYTRGQAEAAITGAEYLLEKAKRILKDLSPSEN